MDYRSPEEFILKLRTKLEEELMDLAVLKRKAIDHDSYPDAAKFRDIEQRLLTLVQSLTETRTGWLQRY